MDKRKGMRSRLLGLLLTLSVSVAPVGCLGSGATQPSKAVTITSISLTPANGAVTVGKTLQYSAQATYSDGSTKDITSSATWATSDSSIATVSSSGLLTGVKLGLAQVGVGEGGKQTSVLLNVTTKHFNQGSLNGDYAFTLTSETSQPRFEVGSIKADGAGNISGIEDINSATGVTQAVSLTGSYTVLADGRGSLTLNTAGQAARTFHFALSANSATAGDNNGQLIQFDKAGTAAGVLLKQDSSALQNTSLATHAYVFRVGGPSPPSASSPWTQREPA
jgi:Big-like domain-containing protein